MKNILITGVRSPAALDLARLFNAAGYRTYGADSNRFPLGRVSNSIERYYSVPAPREDHQAFRDKLLAIIKKNNIDLLIPTCEEVFYVAHHKKELEKYCHVFCSDLDLTRRLHNKYTFSQMMRGFLVKAPKSSLVDSKEKLPTVPHNHSSGIVLKPAFSRFANEALIKPNGSQIKRITPTKANTWVCQDFIKGKEYCTYAVVNKGNLTAFSCYSLAHRADGSAGFYFKAVTMPVLEEFVREFVKRYHYHGQISFDLIKAETDKFYVLECNPRATSGLHLFNTKDNLTEAFINSQSTCHPAHRTRPKMLALAMLSLGLKSAIESGTLRQWWKDFKSAKDVFYQNNDVKPALIQVISLFEYLFTAVLKGISPSQATTHDIEWNGETLE